MPNSGTWLNTVERGLGVCYVAVSKVTVNTVAKCSDYIPDTKQLSTKSHIFFNSNFLAECMCYKPRLKRKRKMRIVVCSCG